ncbi:MAG: S46 family peptidase [Saprospiraceae bacterium]|nr:S46 family peptidase [Saprospiraceae bacterium]MBK7796829.1 S46 family peptidase [Saprospiraceae bacterium]MBL0259792.1 S46 family peptidase [Saprospiraceae bacterium]
MQKQLLVIIVGLCTLVQVQAQQDLSKPQRFDYGKMWTFENPPKEWFKEAYGFTPPDDWYSDVRKSALRFASWCSASFVSPNGLIMTNHHCSRDVAPALQKEGEDFEKNGFYAATLADERKSEGLFVEQLIMVDDISDKVLSQMDKAKDDNERAVYRDSALAQISREYSMKDGWKGLRLQTVTYYSGGKFSMYGYKKYNDIRLVFIPETDLGFFGGAPDNFTYPRYDLDCTFWRAYDENGNPLNTSDHYFKFNIEGAKEGEPVFVVGNPGNTERYRTYKQLEYDRDIRFPAQIAMLTSRHNMMLKEYEKNPNVDLLNDIFGLSNSMKAFTGILGGLKTPALMTRKKATEDEIRSKTKLKGEDPWNELGKIVDGLRKYGSTVTLASPSDIKGAGAKLIHVLGQYEAAMEKPNNGPNIEKLRKDITNLSAKLNEPKEKELFALYLQELKDFEHPEFKYVDKVLDGKSPMARVEKILDKTDFTSTKELSKILEKPADKFKKYNDPLLDVSRQIVPKFNEAVNAFQSTLARRRALEAKIANHVFKVKGNNLPPDATFTLRLADGLVKAYDYNGTTAPYKTSYYGLYDRNTSFDGKYPFALPARWQNPPVELLKAPMNFVSTNDIIGGNSGSAIINKNKEAVGLIFDGNIESLPGNFIFDESSNRSVSVHAGGIYAALKYIYRAERLAGELSGK